MSPRACASFESKFRRWFCHIEPHSHRRRPWILRVFHRFTVQIATCKLSYNHMLSGGTFRRQFQNPVMPRRHLCHAHIGGYFPLVLTRNGHGLSPCPCVSVSVSVATGGGVIHTHSLSRAHARTLCPDCLPRPKPPHENCRQKGVPCVSSTQNSCATSLSTTRGTLLPQRRGSAKNFPRNREDG